MKFAKLAVTATLLAATPIVVNAQPVGTVIMGNDGNPIGTVISNDGTSVVVDTGTYKTPALPIATFANGPELNMTQAQLNAQLATIAANAKAEAEAKAAAEAEAKAKLAAAIAVGTPVISNDNMELGAIDQVNGDNIVIKTIDEGLVTLTRNFFALSPDGQLQALAPFETLMAAAVGG